RPHRSRGGLDSGHGLLRSTGLRAAVMGKCLQTVHAFKQNITGGGSFESLAAGTSDSLSVPNFAPGSVAQLLEAWGGNFANSSEFSIPSPDFHDHPRGLRLSFLL